MMEIPFTAFTFIESTAVGVLLGASTVAVITYALSLRYGYPREGVGHHIIQSVYTLMRLFHIFLVILVAVALVLFGIFDGVLEAQVEYGAKAVLLLINGVIAYLMARRLLPVAYGAAGIAAGWYFIASFHTYTANAVMTDPAVPVVWYVLFVIAFQLVFIGLRYFVKPVSDGVQ